MNLNTLRVLYLLILWDLNKMLRRAVFVAMRVIWFVIQVTVFGLALTAMVRLRGSLPVDVNYYEFYLLGIYTSMLFSISVSRAYDIAEEFEEGIVEYHLSLPISRRVFAVGRTIGGGVASFLFTLPMFAVVLWLLKDVNVEAVIISLSSALLFAMSITGFVLSIVLSLKSGDATDIMFGVLDSLLIRLSTVFYPAIVLSRYAPYLYVALVNPISHIADFLRTLFLFEEYRAIAIASPIAMASYILGLAVGLSSLAMYIVEKKVEGGGWR